MPAKCNLIGMRFGRLQVIEQDGYKGRATAWKCLCDCGEFTTVRVDILKQGRTISCGCAHKGRPKHGLYYHSAYRSWAGMMQRCYDASHVSYKDYALRGIKVCERWHNVANFIADMGERPEKLSLDRIDNNGNYEPLNCRWATNKEQNSNTRANVFVTFNGETKTASQWAEEFEFNQCSLLSALKRGASFENIVKKWSKK